MGRRSRGDLTAALGQLVADQQHPRGTTEIDPSGLTWMADAGVPLHVLRKVAGHGNIATTQRYPHPDHQSIIEAGNALSAYLTRDDSAGPPKGPQQQFNSC
ncbi:hypothetical protein GCM10009854_49000 [Saccharopolyspora halophila]|uniref:Tyr recombinase domain-containing protein n=1 Tax=Saccharopolyspora halophila TaxID=405551 RepID=A0ABN3GX90_9PSEU